METYSVFGQPVATFDVDYDDVLLAQTIKDWKRMTSYPRLKKGITNFEWGGNFLEEAKLTQLTEDLEKCCDLYTEKFNLESVIIATSWFNIIYQGGELEFHDHTLSETQGYLFPVKLSGAFYFKIAKDSAPLVFQKTGEPSFKLYPQNGRLIIFPDHLSHGVEVNKSVERGTLTFGTEDKKIATLFRRMQGRKTT
jgi:hypothetical protein